MSRETNNTQVSQPGFNIRYVFLKYYVTAGWYTEKTVDRVVCKIDVAPLKAKVCDS